MQPRTTPKRPSVTPSIHQQPALASISIPQTHLVPNTRILNQAVALVREQVLSDLSSKSSNQALPSRHQRVANHVISKRKPSKLSFNTSLSPIPENMVIGDVASSARGSRAYSRIRSKAAYASNSHTITGAVNPPIVEDERRQFLHIEDHSKIAQSYITGGSFNGVYVEVKEQQVPPGHTQLLPTQIGRPGLRIPPSHKLGDNILFRCFWFAQQGDPSALEQIIHVNKRWRNIAMRYPALWSHFTIMEGEQLAMARVKKLAIRAWDVPLTVCFIQPFNLPSVEAYEAWNEVKILADRMESLALECVTEDVMHQHLGIICQNMNRLTHLSITVCRDSDSDDGNFGLGDIPNIKVPHLRSLTLNVFKLPRPVPRLWFIALQRISIVDQFSGGRDEDKPMSGQDLLQFIAGCPTLKEFSFKNEISVSWYKQSYDSDNLKPEVTISNALYLPMLSCVQFTGHITVSYTFFENVLLPNLTTLELDPRPAYAQGEQEGFYRRILDVIINAEHLQTLRLDSVDPAIFFESSTPFGRLHHLKYLHLRHISDFEPMLRALTVPFQDKEGEYWNLPRLEELEVQAFVREIPFDKFQQMIGNRFKANRDAGKPVAFSSFIVGTQHLLSKSSQGRIRPYETLAPIY